MTGAEPLVGVALGLGLGARHALEPDHLAAVSVLSADGPSPRRGALIGALWGAGHTLSLLACGLGVALVAERMPPRLSDTFEIGVAAMLVFLGGRAVLRSMHETPRGRPVAHRHRHRAGHVRPLVVGAVHGLAGSGALTALVIARLSDTGARLLFMLLFGLGSVAAMSAISGVAGWPLARLARSPAASRVLLAVTGAMSALFGVLYAFLVARGRLQ